MTQPANRLESLRNLQVANLDVAFAAMFGAMVGGSLQVSFIKHFGGGDLWISLLAAIPALCGLAQIPGAIWGRSRPDYKGFIAPGGWMWRLMHLPLILLPLAGLALDVRLGILIACVGIAAVAVQIVSPIYNDWMAEMVPSNSRGWYFSRRTLIMTAAGASAGLLGGMLIDFFGDAGLKPVGFSVVFGIGCAFGLISMIFFLRMKDMTREAPVQNNLRESLRQLVSPARDRNFRFVLLFTAVFSFSQGFGGQFYAAFALEVLKLPLENTMLQIFGVSHTIGTIIFVKMWGFLADKYGNKPILTLTACGTIITPVLWIACQPGQTNFALPILIIGHLYNGLVWSGVGVTQGNMYMATADPDDRANYLAATSAVMNLSLGVSPLLGSLFLSVLRSGLPAELAYKYLFGAVILIRIAAWLALIPIKEPGANSLRVAIAQMVKVKPSGVRALRQITSSTDEASREMAAAEIGKTGMTLGIDELIKALADPSPRVRRQAVQSLSQLDSDIAGRAVIRHVKENKLLAEEETMEALANCGLPDAGPVLISFMQDPRSILRRSAAKALGALGDPSAIPQLIQAAQEPEDIDLRRSAIQALRLLEAREAQPVFAAALSDPHPSIRTAAAEAVEEMELKDLAPHVRSAMARYPDDTSSEMAYALGVAGQRSDMTAILKTAQRMTNQTLRRRCLMGAARLLGVEGDFYHLVAQEEIGRDQALLKKMRPLLKTVPETREALDRYSVGNEASALILLDALRPELGLRDLADNPVDELFLVAILHTAERLEDRTA